MLLQRSSELLMDCVKTLQKKLDAEVLTRRSYQRESQKEKDYQVKKIDRYIHVYSPASCLPLLNYPIHSIETRLDKLKSNLKRGILGMDKVLQGMHQPGYLQDQPCGDGFQFNEKTPIIVN